MSISPAQQQLIILNNNKLFGLLIYIINIIIPHIPEEKL